MTSTASLNSSTTHGPHRLSRRVKDLARHLRVEGAGAYEESLASVGALGLVGAAFAAAVARLWNGHAALPPAPLVLAVTGVVLLGARSELPVLTRLFALGTAAAAAAALPAPWAPLPFAVVYALAAGHSPATWALALVGLVAGGAWFTAVVGLLPRHGAGAWALSRAIVTASPGVFLGLGLLLPRLRVVKDPRAATLGALPRLDAQAATLWTRWNAAVAALPRGQALSRLEALGTRAVEACALVGQQLARVDELWAGLDVERVRSESSDLRAQAQAEADPAVRATLMRAVRLQSDALEQVDALERRRSRLEAELKAAVVLLERAVVQVELAPASSAHVLETATRLEGLFAERAAA